VNELRRLCGEYGIGRLQKAEDILGGGLVNANVKLRTARGCYVLRILLRDIELERLEYAYFITATLKDSGIPAIVPLLNNEGVPYARYKKYFVQMTEFVEGLDFQQMTTQAYHSGQMLRRMHDALMDVEKTPPITGAYEYIQLDPDSIRERLIENGYTLPKEMSREIKDYYQLIEDYPFDISMLPDTIIHGDWNPQNQLFNEDGEVCCFMDFDTLQRGKRIFDIAYALYFYLIFQGKDELGQAFLEGYGCLTPEEIEVLPVLIARISIYFGILVDVGPFRFAQYLPQLKWLISEQGMATVQGYCVTGDGDVFLER